MPLIAISRAEDAASVAGYWQEQHFTFPYAAQEDRTVYHLFAKSGIPRIYVVDAELTIRSVFTDNPWPVMMSWRQPSTMRPHVKPMESESL